MPGVLAVKSCNYYLSKSVRRNGSLIAILLPGSKKISKDVDCGE